MPKFWHILKISIIFCANWQIWIGKTLGRCWSKVFSIKLAQSSESIRMNSELKLNILCYERISWCWASFSWQGQSFKIHGSAQNQNFLLLNDFWWILQRHDNKIVDVTVWVMWKTFILSSEIFSSFNVQPNLGWTFLLKDTQWLVWAHETWDMRHAPSFSSNLLLPPLSLSLSDHWMDKEQKPGTNVQSNFRARAEKSDSPDVRWYKMFNTLWNLFENTLRYFDPTAWRTGSRFFFNYLCFMSPPPSSRDNKREEILKIQSSEMKMEKLN